MRNQKNSHELIRQNEQIVKKSQKHDVNLQKNSTLYFQIGLIVCLIAAFGLLEMRFETKIPKVADVITHDDDLDEISITNFEPYVEPKNKVQQEQVKQVTAFINKIEEIDNEERKQIETVLVTKKSTPVTPAIDPNKIVLVENPDDDKPISIIGVQKVPIYPGCEKSKNNKERKKCMSDKIGKLIQRKFNGNSIASDNGLTGRQRINVQFTIDKTGHVIDVKTTSPHPMLDKEAERVINYIPEMEPGRQNNKDIGVIYNLPIMFEVR